MAGTGVGRATALGEDGAALAGVRGGAWRPPEWAGPGARLLSLAWNPSAEHGIGTYITDAVLGCLVWTLPGRGRS